MAGRKDVVQVMGRRWDTTRPNFFAAAEGMSLEDIVLKSLRKAYDDKVYTEAQYLELCAFARVRWNGMEVARENWKRIFPQKGDRIEVLHGVRGGGGGGGKNPIATVLSVIVVAVAAALTWWAGGAGAAIPLGLTAAQFTTGVALVSAGMLMAVNMLFPAQPPSLGGLGGGSSEKESPTYSLSGGKNAHNVDGYVPLILGKHRFTPPLGAKSWTEWRGDDQYFNMLVVWGHPDVTVTDFRIGDTALDKYEDVKHNFIQSTTGTKLKYFAKQYNEESVGAALKYNEWVKRTVGVCNDISIDVCFPGGLTTINQSNGHKENRTVEIQIQFRATASKGKWMNFPVTSDMHFNAGSLKWTQAEVEGKVSVFYKSGKLQAVPRGQTVSGGIRIFPKPTLTGINSATGMAYLYGCAVTVTPSGSKLKVVVTPGEFKYANKKYTVGGGKLSSWSSWDDVYGMEVQYAVRGGKDTTLEIDSPFVVGVNSKGEIVKSAGVAKLYPAKASGVTGGGVTWEWKTESYYSSYDDTYGTATSYLYANVKSGTCKVSKSDGKCKIIGAKQKQIVRNFTIDGLTLKSYDVQIRRLTKDSNDSYIIDECEWMNMRAIIDKPAFDTPVPICVSELHIKASEQLSGYVTEFNALCCSHFPDWTPQHTEKKNGKTVTVAGSWDTKRDTRNPASIMRYLLTSKHSLIKPFSAKRLDNDSLVALWKWCKSNEFYFDFVADSEENLWSRLVSVLAPALAAPTTDVDGLWGAIYDKPGKLEKQLFTPRNSWGMSIQRTFAKLPDALRVKYIDEDDDYAQKESFVYNDGFNKDGSKGKKKANDIVQWEFPGVTSWKRIHKLGRYHLAQLMHRQMTVTINTDWEWVAVHRGDLVGLASDVLMNTLCTARIRAKLYQIPASTARTGRIAESEHAVIEGKAAEYLAGPGDAVPSNATLIGVELDDTVVFSEGKKARYGMAVRNAKGALNVLEVKNTTARDNASTDVNESVYAGGESAILYFSDVAVAKEVAPAIGDLVSVSVLHSEYEKYLVSSITPGGNLSAQLTLVPYKTEEIMKAANSKIPPYDVPVILDVAKGKGLLPTPQITSVVSDERVAQVVASGAVQVNIGAAWAVLPSTELPEIYTLQMQITDKANANDVKTGTGSSEDEYILVTNVREGRTVYCKIRIVDNVTGRTSAWSNVVEHKIAGLVAPPPAPKNLKVKAAYPGGITLSWDESYIVDLHHYAISCSKDFLGGQKEVTTKGRETSYTYEPKRLTGELKWTVKAVDTTKHLSKTGPSVSMEIAAPQAPTVTLAQLENDGVAFHLEAAQGTWPISHYSATVFDRTATSQTQRVVVVPPENVDLYKASGTAKCRDVYENWGAATKDIAISIPRPSIPKPDIGVNGNGTAVIQWQDCKVVSDIRHYTLAGCVSGTTTGTSIELNVNNLSEIKWNEEGGYLIGTLYIDVLATDKWGVQSEKWGHGEFEVRPPNNPDLRVDYRADGIHVTWKDCMTTFQIRHYIITDDLEPENPIIAKATSIALKPRLAGKTYHIAVQAEDAIGFLSSAMTVNVEVPPVGMVEPSVAVDGADFLISWAAPSAPWPIDRYAVAQLGSNAIEAEADALFCRIPVPALEDQRTPQTWNWCVNAIDIAGNESGWSEACSAKIYPPAEPSSINAVMDGSNVVLSWTADNKNEADGFRLPIVAWRVYRQFDLDGAVTEADYGDIDATSLTIPVTASDDGSDENQKQRFPVGIHTFHVQGVDAAGNIGDVGTVDFTVKAPPSVVDPIASVVDNNVLLYWASPPAANSFPVAFYLLESDLGQGDGYYAEVGRIDSLFATIFEEASGDYTYKISPVDIAGNMGAPCSMLVTVAQPPNFVLYHDYNSVFGGGNYGDSAQGTGRYASGAGRSGFVLDGEGGMLGPYADMTWNENLAAIAAAKSATAGNVTWTQKAGWGFERWLDPPLSSATYVEYVDVTRDDSGGNPVYIPSTTIKVTINWEKLSGDPEFSCRIETSKNGTTWTVEAENAFETRAEDFKYVRYTIGLTGGTAIIRGINYKLFVTRLEDSGSLVVDADDNDAEWTSMAATPMLTGKWVSFKKKFVDIESLPRPNVRYDPAANSGLSLEDTAKCVACTVFVDSPNPQGFRVFVLDKNGDRVTARVDWSAIGV